MDIALFCSLCCSGTAETLCGTGTATLDPIIDQLSLTISLVTAGCQHSLS